jgi:hypothetical protein
MFRSQKWRLNVSWKCVYPLIRLNDAASQMNTIEDLLSTPESDGQRDRGANAAVGTYQTRGTTSLRVPGMQSALNSLMSEVQA